MKASKGNQLDEIRSALKDRNLTAVAAETGLNPHTIYKLVNGTVKPNKSTMNLISMYLRGISVKND